MSERPNQHADDSAHNAGGNQLVVRIDAGAQVFLWGGLAIAVCLVSTLFLYFEYRDLHMQYALTYNRAVKIDSYLEAHGINTQNFGPLPHPP